MKEFVRQISNHIKSDSLHGRFARGGIFLAGGTVIERGLRLVRQIVLAKIITPDDLGLVAICVAVLAMFEAASEVGIRYSVIQNKIGDQYGYLNASWWFQAARGAILGCLGMIAAGWIAVFYEDPALTNILRVAFLAVVFSGLSSPRAHVLEKQLHFGRYIVLNQGSMLAGTVLTIVLVFLYQNVWAVIIGFSSEQCIRFVLSFILCPFLPHFQVDRKALKELSAYAKGMFGMPILTLLAFQAEVFVLGKMLPKEQVGLYAMTLLLARIPRDLAVQIIGKLLMPVFSIKQDDDASLRKGLCEATRWVTLGIAPLSGFFAACAAAVLIVIYTPQYVPMATAFIIMSITVFLRVQAVILATMYYAINQLSQQRLFVIIRIVVMGALIVPMTRAMGFNGAAMSALIGELSGFLLQVIMLNRRIKLSANQYLGSMMPGVILGIGGYAICLLLRCNINLSNWAILGSGIGVLVLCYGSGLTWQFGHIRALFPRE
jgi:O-antigen/teichoic acid export membrane protein